MYIYIYLFIYLFIHLLIFNLFYSFIYFLFICLFVYMCFLYMSVYLSMCIYICVCIYVYIYITRYIVIYLIYLGLYGDLSQLYHRRIRPYKIVSVWYGNDYSDQHGHKPEKHQLKLVALIFRRNKWCTATTCPKSAGILRAVGWQQTGTTWGISNELAVDFENAFPPANAQEIESVQIYFFLTLTIWDHNCLMARGGYDYFLAEFWVANFRVAGSLLTRQIVLSALKT